MKVYLASDHRGFELKVGLFDYCIKKKLDIEDLGAFEYVMDDDYVDYAALVASAVSNVNTDTVGILLCGSGMGMCVVANKYRGVRAVNVWDVSVAKDSRSHDGSNVLCLPADHLTFDEAKAIVDLWLKTKTSRIARHARRLKKITALEKSTFS